MKKQELISIEEQLYAKGIWKRPLGNYLQNKGFDELEKGGWDGYVYKRKPSIKIWGLKVWNKKISGKKIKNLYINIVGDLTEDSVRYLYG